MNSISNAGTSLRSQYFLLFILLLCSVPFLSAAFFVHPSADDYCIALNDDKAGFWQLYLHQYLTWSGRYSMNFLAVLNPTGNGNLAAYRLVPVLVILLSVAGIYYFLVSLTKDLFSRIQILNVSILFQLIHLSVMPAIAQGIYWYTGAITYQPGIIFSLFYFGSICNYLDGKFLLNKTFHFIIMLLCLAIALGFSEGITLLLSGFHIALIWYRFKTNQNLARGIWILLALATLLSVIMLFSPGNLARAQHFPESNNLFHSIWFTFLQIIRFGLTWGLSLPCLISCLLLVLFRNEYEDKLWIFRSPLVKPVVLAAFILWVFFINIFPAYWSTNILGQHRTVNIACFFFLAAWPLFVSSCAIAWIPEKLKKLPRWNSRQAFALMIALIISIFISGNGYSLLSDTLNGKVKNFDREMTERAIYLRNNKDSVVYVQHLKDAPASLFVLELSADSTNWVNFCQAKYFGVKHIVCKK